MTTFFYSLTPEAVLAAVEQAGHRTTGLCYALNSLENRVYEVELEDGARVVGKFYRPGRHTREAIQDEHRLLAALTDLEVPVCAPTPFPTGATLSATTDGILFALFPRTGGRSPDELLPDQLAQLGRLLGRIHNVSASLALPHRPTLAPKTYGTACLQQLLAGNHLPPSIRTRYVQAVEALVARASALLQELPTFVVHADCHKGNLLHGRDGWFFLDFDDMAHGPAVQDFWLLLPARPRDCPAEVDALVGGYEQFRAFDPRGLAAIEALRGLRYVRYATWVASRWQDPAFPRAFDQWGTETYWQRQLNDLQEQLAVID